MGAVAIAAKGKGGLNAARRALAIGRCYGLTPRRMEERLADVLAILERYRCSGTVPVTASAAERHPDVIARYAELGIEFAVHGYHHVDHTALSGAVQRDQLARARRVLHAVGADAEGFRAPYLRWNAATLAAVRDNRFLYDSSQALSWPIDPQLETDSYRRVLAFYGAVAATERPALPWLEDGVLRIPYCLPDDEAVVDRLDLGSPEEIADLWLGIFRMTHQRGELFTLGVHPERIVACAAGVRAVFEAAGRASPPVWLAGLGEVALWWRARATATVTAVETAPGHLHICVTGPRRLTILARNVAIPGAQPWSDDWVRVPHTDFELRSERRPFVAVPAYAPAELTACLREEGFVPEVADSDAAHAVYVDRDRFTPADRESLVAEVQATGHPLVRLGRWPGGARSALALSGDLDAFTIQDYALRVVGR